MESEVLRVKHGISNSLNQLQFLSIFDICHQHCQITDATRHVGENKMCVIKLQLYKSP